MDQMPVDNNARQEIQNNLVSASLSSLKGGRDVFIDAPTGFGKTNIGISISQNAQIDPKFSQDKGVHIFAQDRISLSEQNAQRARKLGHPDVAVWNDGDHSQKGSLIFTTIDTALIAKDTIPKVSLLIIDEAHHAGETSPNTPNSEYTELIETLTKKNPDMKIVAMSGTKERADEKKLHPRLERADNHPVTMYQAMSTQAVLPVETEQGDWTGKNGKSVLSTLKEMSQDPKYKPEDFTDIVRSQKPDNFSRQVVEQWQRHAPNTPTFAYSDSIEDSENLADAFKKAGISAATIHSGLTKKQISNALEGYRSGKITVLSSVDMLTEGIDETKTQTILNAKTSVNRLELAQMKGRATRAHTEQTPEGPKEKTKAKIIEMGATPYVTGTAESLIDTETMIAYGSRKSRMPVWKTTSKDPKVVSIPTENATYYAVNTGEKGGPTGKMPLYHIYSATPRRTNDAGRGVTIKKLTKAPATGHDAGLFAIQIAKDHKKWIALKESLDTNGNAIPGIRFTKPEQESRPPTLLSRIAHQRWKEQGAAVIAAHETCNAFEQEQKALASRQNKIIDKNKRRTKNRENDFGM